MYNFRWIDSALDSLANIYVAVSPDERARIAAGVKGFNRRIGENPHEVGESRSGRYRIEFLPLVVVFFHIDEEARLVEVTVAARFGH